MDVYQMCIRVHLYKIIGCTDDTTTDMYQCAPLAVIGIVCNS